MRAYGELQTKSSSNERTNDQSTDALSAELSNLRSEVHMLRKDKQNLLEDLNMQQNQFSKSDRSLRQLLDQLSASSQQNLSLRNDVALLRKTVISLDADKLNLIQKINEIESELARAKLNVENLTLELDMAKAAPSIDPSVADSYNHLRQSLQQNHEELSQLREENLALKQTLTNTEAKL
ncbi:unnamed protein product [Soboliphyme baturini]|uniref:GOLGA2L5 domain-containing protein n=1 Tax=Soboliphyme baturini TaxID=241478 RepID=A0A183J6V1_9BILA|nr:unnamed protein product [Soboliphyme baturini]